MDIGRFLAPKLNPLILAKEIHTLLIENALIFTSEGKLEHENYRISFLHRLKIMINQHPLC